MKDNFGNEMHTGDIVKVENAYHRFDNGFYFIEQGTDVPGNSRSDCALRKISKDGTILEKGIIHFWPMAIFTGGKIDDEAVIEVRNDIIADPDFDICDMYEAFQGKIDAYREKLDYFDEIYTQESDCYRQNTSIRNFYIETLYRLQEEYENRDEISENSRFNVQYMENLKHELYKIAAKSSYAVESRGNLLSEGNDTDDFLDISVSSLEDMLMGAYLLGRKEEES